MRRNKIITYKVNAKFKSIQVDILSKYAFCTTLIYKSDWIPYFTKGISSSYS